VKPSLNWNDRATCKAWLDDLRGRCDDVIAVADDQTAQIAKRKLGRAAAVQLLAEAASSLDELFAFAARGLADDDEEPGSGDPSGSGGAGPIH